MWKNALNTIHLVIHMLFSFVFIACCLASRERSIIPSALLCCRSTSPSASCRTERKSSWQWKIPIMPYFYAPCTVFPWFSQHINQEFLGISHSSSWVHQPRAVCWSPTSGWSSKCPKAPWRTSWLGNSIGNLGNLGGENRMEELLILIHLYSLS